MTSQNAPNEKKKGSAMLNKLGQDMACIYLSDNGLEILERNWKSKSGSAAIIATEDNDLVFIEVKTRPMSYSGLPEDTVTTAKRNRYEKIAIDYLVANQRPSSRIRFDIIAIKMTGDQQCLLRHHRDAFGVSNEQRREPSSTRKKTPGSESKPKQKAKASKARER